MKRLNIKFYALLVIGFVLALIGLLSPPVGVVDNSVLIMLGEVTILAGGVIGCVVHLDFRNMYFHIGRMNESIATEEKKRVQTKQSNEDE